MVAETIQKKANGRKKEHSHDHERLVKEAKLVWEKLRNSKTPAEKKQELSKALHDMVRGKAKELIFAHDTSRVLQCLLAAGNKEIRDDLFDELSPELKRMCKTQYARFFVVKLLKHGSKQQRETIIESLRGSYPRLLQSTLAATIVELIYNDYATPAQRFAILAEFYGKEYALLGMSKHIKSVAELVAQHPVKGELIMKQLEGTLKSLVDKNQFRHSIVSKLLFDYFSLVNASQKAEMIALVRERLPEICHTREGAEVSLECVWHSNAKDRKTIVKTFNGLAVKTANDQYARRVLMGFFDQIDDTTILKKYIIKELGDNIADVVFNPYGNQVLHYMVHPRNVHVFGRRGLVDLLKRGDDNAFSKKEASARYAEIYAAIEEPLHQFLAANMRDVLFNKTSAVLVFNALEPSDSEHPFKRKVDDEHLKACFDAIAEIANDEYVPHAPSEDKQPHILQGGPARFVLKKLLKADNAQPKIKLSASLAAKLPAEQLNMFLAQNSGCFDLLHMAVSGSSDARRAVLSAVSLKALKKKADAFVGAKYLLEELKSELK